MEVPLRRRVAFVAIATAAVLLTTCTADDLFTSGWGPGVSSHALTVSSAQRTYELFVPSKRPVTSSGAPRNFPLLILMHGSSGDAEGIRAYSNLDSLGEVGRFVIAYPNGSDGGGLYPSDWNAGTCCGEANRQAVDDLGFLGVIMDEVAGHLPVDKTRIYVAGFSDGARMAYHAACQMSTRVAAIGVVSGSLLDDQCHPPKQVALFAVHGTADDQVPYNDSALTNPPKPVPSAAASLPSSVRFWVAQNGCTSATSSRVSPSVTRTIASHCGAAVVFYSVTGGSHTWPGAPGSQPPMSELQTSQLMAQFLLAQVRR